LNKTPLSNYLVEYKKKLVLISHVVKGAVNKNLE
jgi:hypothetical protein